MSEARRLTLAQLRDVVTDPGELAKGTRFADEGGLAHLARFEHKLYADAVGSGAAYKVQIAFEADHVRGRCSCMAARTRPFCKHAAALLVAWARTPEAFAVADVAPAGPDGPARKKQVKKGRVDDRQLMGRGVEQVATLLRELAASGVAALAADRAEQVHALGETLREAKLRRLSARTLMLAGHLERAASRGATFDAPEYAELVGDMLLTIRKLDKYVGGEALADEHVEELIGKTWTKKDRRPVADLELVEYAFSARTTPDDFVIRESRFVDLATGGHFSEKQILPGFLARRTQPKKSWAGRLLAGASGSLYPTFAPRRLDLEHVARDEALTPAALERLVAAALPGVGATLAALQERRRDVFAPDALPVALRVDRVLATGARLQAVDDTDAALFLPEDQVVDDALARVLSGARLVALLGDVALDGALPTLFPLAAVVAVRGTASLVPLGASDAAAVLAMKKARARQPAAPATRWVDVARRVGVSPAAVALGEVREELADALGTGLASLSPRRADPMASRLRDLGLAKQADLLAELGRRGDAADKLDDFVKLHQVLGIALARLAGATQVDAASLVAVPTYESVVVPRPERALPPDEVAALRGAGRLDRYQAAWHYAFHYDALPPEDVATSIFPAWADGSAAPFVARACTKSPAAALAAARRALGIDAVLVTGNHPWMLPRTTSRAAKLTAIRVLEALGSDEARRLLVETAQRREIDAALTAHARRALSTLGGAPEDEARRAERERLVRAAQGAGQKEERARALRSLASGAFVGAIAVVRASFFHDAAADVRQTAAFALAQLGDVDAVTMFVRMLRDRAADPEGAKTGARALGMLGDVRGLDELLSAYGEGWQPGVVADALREIGPAALGPVLALIEAHPEIADRKAALGVVGALPAGDVAALVGARLEAAAGDADFVEHAALLVAVAAASPQAGKAVAARVLALRPDLADKGASKEARALARRCAKLADGRMPRG